MKSSSFSLERPRSMEQALATKARFGSAAQFLAGGQSLMPAMAMRFSQSECLIDLTGLEDLKRIKRIDGKLIIGAMATHAEVIASPEVAHATPLLLQAGRYLAHAAIRNRGTFGGSVALADPAAEWPAACMLLDARIQIVSEKGRREVVAGEFFQGMYRTDLAENELVEAIVLPAQSPDEKNCVLELARRQGDFASAAVMACGVMHDGRLSDLKMVFFAVADLPLRLPVIDAQLQELFNLKRLAAVDELVKTTLSKKNLRADLYMQASTKAHLCGVLARRAIEQLSASSARGT
jgi:carbon-monoxide dehydrogenase medium subunit